MSPVQTVGSINELPWDEIRTYLTRYGYLEGTAVPADEIAMSTASREPSVVAALRRFQELHGIGGRDEAELAQSILETVRSPRCGFRDVRGGQDRPKGCPWPTGQQVLIYKVQNGPDGLELAEVADAILIAINRWNTALGRAGIRLAFRKKEAGDGDLHVRFSWETPGAEINAVIGTPVAHADFPPRCALLSTTFPRPVVFDRMKPWVPDSSDPNRFNITAVALHEIGHILGLAHSKDPRSVMFPDLLRNDQLAPGDEAELANLYRKRPKGASRRPSREPEALVDGPVAEGALGAG